MNTSTLDLYRFLPSNIRDKALMLVFGFFKVPMLGWIRPKVLRLDEEMTEIAIPLNRRTKNHLNSMYFGVLAAGADCAGGLSAMKQILESERNISLVFKDFKANFLKRAEGNTHFICRQGKEISKLIEKTIETGERENLSVFIEAVCPDVSEEVVANFELTLSLKDKTK